MRVTYSHQSLLVDMWRFIYNSLFIPHTNTIHDWFSCGCRPIKQNLDLTISLLTTNEVTISPLAQKPVLSYRKSKWGATAMGTI